MLDKANAICYNKGTKIKGETAMSEKEYWKVRMEIALKDRLYEVADEVRWDIGEVLNRCVEFGLKHQNEWAKPKNDK